MLKVFEPLIARYYALRMHGKAGAVVAFFVMILALFFPEWLHHGMALATQPSTASSDGMALAALSALTLHGYLSNTVKDDPRK